MKEVGQVERNGLGKGVGQGERIGLGKGVGQVEWGMSEGQLEARVEQGIAAKPEMQSLQTY